ncbi:TetR/AcrR family transcriptional regulator [Streptomyces boluensis]|uniref:TetR family transcriptional regulator n=1 Tax=Streptomyces boluensis TaxID=1775135 RepID=A0A964UV56_9ACTN|nr:TetR/AcrR family transcriptional regulator [Streptomyces boluensis]NBE54950.1 TetR family transcriptional regulator [Streptomyces boluensis]
MPKKTAGAAAKPTSKSGAKPAEDGAVAARPRRERRSVRREAALTAAFRIAEQEGAAGLSMRRVAQELSVDVTALYRVFRDKDELLLALCERVIESELAELGDVPDDEPWQDTLRRIAATIWESQLRFPAITVLTFARITGGPAERRMVELLVDAFARSGLPRDRVVLFYRAFVDSVLGLCAHSAVLGSLDPEVREKDDTTWSRVYAHLPETDHPATRAHIAELTAVTQKSIYDTAVEALLTATERAAAGEGAGGAG